jgi:inorganic pyrophosphatase
MNIDKIAIGKDPPFDINVLIEIPQGGEPVKYEFDKESGALMVDRFLAEDGDPCDVLVVGRTSVVPGAIIRSRPVGALLMEDEAGPDEKIIAVPVDALHPYYTGVRSFEDLPVILRDQIAHFFQHYKDLEKDKWVSIVRWIGPDECADLIRRGIARAAGAS